MIRKLWDGSAARGAARLRELAFRAVEWAREEYRFHERQLAEASIELEKRRDGWEYWGNLVALGVGVLLPTFVLLSPACDPGASPPPSLPAKRPAPDDEGAVRTRAQYGVQRAVAESLAGFLEAVLNGNGRAARSYLSETCRPEDVDEVASFAELLGQARGGLAKSMRYAVEVDDGLLTVAKTGPRLVTALFTFEDAVHISMNGRPVPTQAIFGEIGTGTFEFREEDGLWLLTECREMASGIRDALWILEDWLDRR